METARDIVQIGFWVSVSIVSWLTYVAAKRTLLQPLRTEVFKQQLQVLSELLHTLGKTQEVPLRQTLAYDELLTANATALYDQFVGHFFDIKIDPTTRPYADKLCAMAIVTEAGMLRDYEVVDRHTKHVPEEPAAVDVELKHSVWAKWTLEQIRVPNEHTAKVGQLEDILANPLLPSSVAESVRSFLAANHENLEILRSMLSEAAQELPQKYPNKEVLKQADFSWLASRFNRKLIALEPKAAAIAEAVRTYTASDSLVK